MADFKISYAPHVAGAVVTAATILASHVALWPYRGRVHQLVKYAVGLGCVGLGLTVKNLHTRDYDAITTFWALAGTAGVVTGLLHGMRELGHQRRERVRKAVRNGVQQRRD